jgi:large subunit ribosomal protein L29
MKKTAQYCNDLRAKSVEELKAEAVALLREQFSLRMQQGTQQLAKPSELKRVRRNIARIRTVLAQKAA